MEQNVRTTRKVNSERTFPIPLQKFLANLKSPFFQWKKYKNGKTSKCLKANSKCKHNFGPQQLQTNDGQTNQTNLQELSALNGIDFESIGAQHFDSGPSHGVPDQANPEKYLNHNGQHLLFIVDNTLYYKDFPTY